jgi:tocopherol cyclase
MLKARLNPDLFHGENKERNFFEGWYFKLVDPNNSTVLSFIPGMTTFNESHCFIQFLQGNNPEFDYVKFDKNDFYFNKSKFEIKLRENLFSLENIHLDFVSKGKHIRGNLKLKNEVNWPDSIINPGSMGFYNYLTFMQCYSQVCSMNSYIEGTIFIDEEAIDFTGGKAYIEKNWGKAFPYSYVWTQCNNFSEEGIALTCSLGHIPFPVSSFTGFLIGLYINKSFYKFTTINHSKLKIYSSNCSTNIEASNNKYILRLSCCAPEKSFMNLYAPRDCRMVPIARESLQGNLRFELFKKDTFKLLYNSSGSCAGLEFGGNYMSFNEEKL